ncbi:MAG: PTS sugar transporter subunit IIA [Sphaerochaeta sp.]|jgi:mannitol/fructose-specific phosphotransferase system IIA component (Ntr-type)|uniref:PTS sugar transporter subunit IIA n=1 Tax=unclassified Sphaerochaeta TaxID=2637943 RepID=UPI000E88BB1A|nr:MULTISPECIES: PTS sugar transporter subunit IIA [unclassified Sphaerochaeta]MCK9599553.1 PTS sugar transporter subunit IIA [Sphaerochaeta sp.]MDX9824696.1 PTS sugar transporter subunit IIA [Sphaerochaeta sp.]MEA4861331.1 PTS sugar transporter subunit IIA [Sphaerochaeta sp.]HAP56228.1 PTS fructose transporter subunit IIC [Sphaerochaeta sp.]HBO36588.1 PTS fructose transporter subunit IIC [Sphaerochaeta sp.]
MNVLDVLDKNLVKVPLMHTDKRGIINELVEVIAKAKGYSTQQFEQILDAVLNRESLGSTGIGNGIAIPHAKTDVVEQVVMVVGISRFPVDFDSPDGQKSRIFFLVLAPSKQASAHVELLASIARTCTSQVFRRMLEQARDNEEVVRLFME